MPDDWLNRAHFLLYPPTCLLCGARGRTRLDLCNGCLAALPAVVNPCRGCGAPLPSGAGEICGRCQRRPTRFDSIVVPFHYAHPMDWLVQRLKFQGRLAHARLLGELLARAVTASGLQAPALVLPVPLHSARLRERGFNQAEEIARHVARRLHLSLGSRCLGRHKATAAQMGLPASQRRANVRGAFVINAPERIAGCHVALVDDVVTTGSTVDELARALKRSGAARVDVWACARA